MDLSIVVPVYNSQNCLAELVARVEAVLEPNQKDFEIILVNDFSMDKSWEKIKELHNKNSRVTGINLRKNFGQDNALMAGLSFTKGKYVVIMDDDLQHDPVYIPDLLEKINSGFDVVYAHYRLKKQKAWKNWGSWANGKVAEFLLKKPPEVYLSPYKILSQDIVRELTLYEGPYPYLDGLIFSITARISQIFIEHRKRYEGKSNYTFWKSLKVLSSLTTSFSVVPLRLVSVLGFFSSFMGFLMGLIFVVYKLFGPEMPNSVTGWTSIIVSVLIIGGVHLLTLGMIGEYIGRMYLNINRKPQYAVREVCRKTSSPDPKEK